MKYYAVKNGRKTGIFTDWETCRAQVEGFSGAEYKSFAEKELAEAYLSGRTAEISQVTASETTVHSQIVNSLFFAKFKPLIFYHPNL